MGSFHLLLASFSFYIFCGSVEKRANYYLKPLRKSLGPERKVSRLLQLKEDFSTMLEPKGSKVYHKVSVRNVGSRIAVP